MIAESTVCLHRIGDWKGTDVDRSATARGKRASRNSGQPTGDGRRDDTTESLPKELGVLLVVAGIGGLLLPGPVGSPFLILGAVTLWPAAFRRVEHCFATRLPRLHHMGMIQIRRFMTDLERRYP